MTHYLVVPDWTPTSLNEVLRGHWSRGHRLKRADRELLCAYARAQGVPRAACRRRVSLLLVLPPKARRLDADNLWKALLDGLVHAGLLVDDGPMYCDLGAVRWARGEERYAVVELTDLER